MARQKGLMKYVGTIGDVRHFKIKGQEGYFAGMVGGPTGEQVYTAPEFQRTRENMSEFAGCAKAGKSIRTALSALMNQMSDSQLTGRLTAIMKKINLEDQTEARGERKVEISTQRQYLDGLDFNRNVSFDSIFNAPYTLAHVVDRNSADFVIPVFNPANLIQAPAGSTHFRLINAFAVISDFVFNEATGTYEPSAPALNELSIIEYSAYQELNAETTALTLTAAFPGTPAITADVSVLPCIGIEFYQKVGTNYYLFSSGNSLKGEEIF